MKNEVCSADQKRNLVLKNLRKVEKQPNASWRDIQAAFFLRFYSRFFSILNPGGLQADSFLPIIGVPLVKKSFT